MGDDDDEPGPSARDVLLDGDDGVRWGRLIDAVRGRGTDATDLLPVLVVGLLAVIVGTPVGVVLEYGALVASELVPLFGAFLFCYAVFALIFVSDRVEEYYAQDEGVAIEELRSRYADGDLELAEFQRRVDLVHEEGAETVWEEGEEEGERSDRDPADILRERYARGEIDEAEFRRRMEVIDESTGDEPVAERVVERDQ